MIKIAFVIDTIESPTAGTEKQLLMLIKHLDRSRFQPYLCVLRVSEWLEKEFDLCPLFVAGIDSFKTITGLKGILRLSGWFKENRINIVQTHFRDSSIAGILAARFAGIKNIIGTRRNQGYWLTPVELKIQKFLDRWVTAYIANSQSTKQWMANTEGVDFKRIEVINNGFDFSMFESEAEPDTNRKQMRLSLGIPEDAPVIGIVANLRPVKDHGTFLQAANIVRAQIPAARFLIIGDGPEKPELQKLTDELNLTDAVIFLGARLDVPRILEACDIGVLSSRSESFSNAIVEYMAAGLPVVTTDVGGAREAVDDGINGFIVPIGDFDEMGQRIIELLKADTIKEMGQESRKRSLDRFELTSMIEKTEHLYDRCLKGCN